MFKKEIGEILSQYSGDKVWILSLKKEYVRAISLDGKVNQEISNLSNEDLELFFSQLAAQVGLTVSDESPHGLAITLPDGTVARFTRFPNQDVLIDIVPLHV